LLPAAVSDTGQELSVAPQGLHRHEGSIDVKEKQVMETRVWSATKEVIIGGGLPTVLIGERINPTGKKRPAEALHAGDLSVVREEALAQVAAGAKQKAEQETT
jgi:hypothetical protein